MPYYGSSQQGKAKNDHGSDIGTMDSKDQQVCGISKTALQLLVNLIQLVNSTRASGTQASMQTKKLHETKNAVSTM